MATPVITDIDNVNKTYKADGVLYAINPKTGRYDVAPTVVPNASLKNTAPVSIPQVQPDTLSGMVLDQTTVANDTQKGADTATANLANAFSTYQSTASLLNNESADQIQNENAQGIPELNREILDLQATARQSKLNYDMTPYSLQAQGRGITTGILRGQEAVKQRQFAIDNLVANSNLAAAEGKLTLAQNLADRATKASTTPSGKPSRTRRR